MADRAVSFRAPLGVFPPIDRCLRTPIIGEPFARALQTEAFQIGEGAFCHYLSAPIRTQCATRRGQ
jgi:hypothetical protein